MIDQCRATQRYLSYGSDGEERLVLRIIELATQYGRYGYRRITALLQREGWQVNHKHVERTWMEGRIESTSETTETEAVMAQ